MKTIYQCQ